jgi:hypothetical protein
MVVGQWWGQSSHKKFININKKLLQANMSTRMGEYTFKIVAPH